MKTSSNNRVALRIGVLCAAALVSFAGSCFQNTQNANKSSASPPVREVSSPSPSSSPSEKTPPRTFDSPQDTRAPSENFGPDVSDPSKALIVIQQMAEQAQARSAQSHVLMNAPDLTGTHWSIYVTISGTPEQFGTLDFRQAEPVPGGGYVNADFKLTSGGGGQMSGSYDGNAMAVAHIGAGGIMIMKAKLVEGRASTMQGIIVTAVKGSSGEQDIQRYIMTAYHETR